jgi:hypothetical protein
MNHARRCLPLFFLLLALLNFCIIIPSASAENSLRFDFKSLAEWEKLRIPGVERESDYSIVVLDSGEQVMKATSSSSASGLISKKEFDPHELPRLCWRWKIANTYQKGDARKKSGDDYPLRIFVVFPYDPDDFSFWQNAKYKSAKMIYGEYPPGRSLNYIWANRPHPESRFRSAYTEMAEQIVLQSGSTNAGIWINEEVDIIADYQKAFGKTAPNKARLAIMNDSDNTKEQSISYLQYIDLSSDKGSSPCGSLPSEK